MSFSLHGLAVSSGIAIGHAHLVSHATREVAQYQVRERDVAAEVARFDSALETVRTELDQLLDNYRHLSIQQLKIEAEASPGAAAELSAFVDLQAMFLADPLLAEIPRGLIQDRRCNAEWALVQQMEQLTAQFDEMEDAYLRERKQDIVQLVERILKVLMGKTRKIARRKSGSDDDLIIVVAHDLSPADTIQFKRLSIGDEDAGTNDVGSAFG